MLLERYGSCAGKAHCAAQGICTADHQSREALEDCVCLYPDHATHKCVFLL